MSLSGEPPIIRAPRNRGRSSRMCLKGIQKKSDLVVERGQAERDHESALSGPGGHRSHCRQRTRRLPDHRNDKTSFQRQGNCSGIYRGACIMKLSLIDVEKLQPVEIIKSAALKRRQITVSPPIPGRFNPGTSLSRCGAKNLTGINFLKMSPNETLSRWLLMQAGGKRMPGVLHRSVSLSDQLLMRLHSEAEFAARGDED